MALCLQLLLLLDVVYAFNYAAKPSTGRCVAFESSYHIEQACECLVYESQGRSHGSFNSVNYPLVYPTNVNCVLYTFIGDMEEIVKIDFVDFDLQRHTANKCADFVQLYTDLERPEISDSLTPNWTLCGNLSSLHQTTFYSSGRSLILEFHTDQVQTNNTGFRGQFQFLDEGQYKMQGETKHGETQCTYDFVSPRQAGGLSGWSSDTIHSPASQFSAAAARSISTSISATAHSSTSPSSSLSKSGRFFSPRFPQNYPPQSACYYQFHAWSNERIQIQFMTVDLEPTDQRCFVKRDVLTIYDGGEINAPVLARYCGRHTLVSSTSTTIISSGDRLLVEFLSDSAVERQGFAATFQFVTSSQLPQPSPSSVKPSPDDFRWTKPASAYDPNTHDPRDSPMIHIMDPLNTSPEPPKYSACNERFISESKSSLSRATYPRSAVQPGGVFTSPFYPKPYGAEADCHYTFLAQPHERVRLEFVEFDLGDVPDPPPFCENLDSVTVYITINGVRRDVGIFCGNRKPTSVMSSDNQLDVHFTSRPSSHDESGHSVVGYHGNYQSTSGSQPRGFKAVYNFTTDFGIVGGEQETDVNGTYVCRFNYKSERSLNGTFTSPNYPGMYPRNTECHYLFYGHDPRLKVAIKFIEFDVEGNPPNCREVDDSDYVEFSNFNIQLLDRKIPKYCNGMGLDRIQRTIHSDNNFFRVTFKSNSVYDGFGFKASYEFQRNDESVANERVMEPNSADRKTASTTYLMMTWLALYLLTVAVDEPTLNWLRRRQCMKRGGIFHNELVFFIAIAIFSAALKTL